MNPYLILAAVLAIAGSGIGGFFYGQHISDTEWTAKVEKDRADAERAARQQETLWQGVVNETVKNFQADVDRVGRDRDAALRSLRNRPERPANLPEAPRTECQGATGAELSRSDAEFLVWEAARADELRAGLVACYAVMDGLHHGQ